MSNLIFLTITIVIAIIAFCKKQWEILFCYLSRCAFGIVFIYLINTISEEVNILQIIGCNGITIGITGLLGLPGLVILYGIRQFIL